MTGVVIARGTGCLGRALAVDLAVRGHDEALAGRDDYAHPDLDSALDDITG